jgi:hypothetical protein
MIVMTVHRVWHKRECYEEELAGKEKHITLQMSRLILNEKTRALPRQPKQTIPHDIKKPNKLGYDSSALQFVSSSLRYEAPFQHDPLLHVKFKSFWIKSYILHMHYLMWKSVLHFKVQSFENIAQF